MSFTRLLVLIVISLQVSSSVYALGILNFNNTASGIITNDSTRAGLSFAHIYNESKRSGAISSKTGHFTITASPGDTLVLSSIGYYAKVVYIPESYTNMVISLKPQLYEIEAVTINAFGDYEHFKQKFLALKLPETETERIQKQMNAYFQHAAGLGLHDKKLERKHLTPALGPEPGMSVAFLSRQDRQRINYTEVLKQEEKQRIVNKKYNRDIVQKVTLLPEDELLDFMIFCNFNTDVLLHATEYEICVLIEIKFKEYKKRKLKGELPESYYRGLCMA